MRNRIITPDIICVGNIVVDAVGVNVDRIPAEGGLALFDRVEMHLGGCANNTAVALSRLGLKVGLVAKVGADGLGEHCGRELTRQGIDIRGLKISHKDSTSFSFIMIPPGGDRRILHTMGANATFGCQDVDARLFQGTRWICVGGTGLLPALGGSSLGVVLSNARKAGAKTAVDTATNDRLSRRDWNRVLASCYEMMDIFFPSEAEACAITGLSEPKRICETFRSRGVKIAGVKLGSKGCAIMSDEGYFYVPAYRVKCIDTLGAGDCFMAGLLAGMLKGYSHRHAALLGNAVSAHCVQSVGATSGIPALKRVLSFQKLITDRRSK